MKKIFMKFCDDRKKDYCLKTIIWKECDKKIVTKEAVFPEAQNFILEISKYPQILSEYYDEVGICPVELKNKKLLFEFIQGRDLEQSYVEAVENSDKDQFRYLIKYHTKLVEGSKLNQCVFENSGYFEKYFGNGEVFNGSAGLKVSNYDATASNILLKEEHPIFIDYEWVFVEPIPRDLVVYHCIRELYEHNRGFEKFISLNEALEMADCQSDQKILENAYWQFFELINGLREDLNFSCKKNSCLKKTELLKDFKLHKIVLEAEVVMCLNENRKIERYWRECSQANGQLNTEAQKYKQLSEELTQDIEPLISLYQKVHGSKTWRVAKKIKKIIKK